MIHRNGTQFNQFIDLGQGFPTGAIAWTLKDETGAAIANGTVTPPSGAVSVELEIPAIHNTLASGVYSGYRDLSWSYEVSGVTIQDVVRYSIEALAPWGASMDGVRRKLGLASDELPDSEISLIGAYYQLLTSVGDPDVSSLVPTPSQAYRLRDAVEAMAGLMVLPSLQLRAAQKQSSGTDTWQRFKVDWELLEARLSGYIAEGALIIEPTFLPFATSGSLLVLARPASDPLTGDTQ